MDNLMNEVDNLLQRYEENVNDQSLFQEFSGIILVLGNILPELTAENHERCNEIINNLSILRNALSYHVEGNQMYPGETPIFFQGQPNYYNVSRRGRPKCNIRRDMLLRLREMGNSWSVIAKMLMVSSWTIYRRIEEFNLNDVRGFSDISDNDLIDLLAHFTENQSRLVGFSMAYGFIRSIGIRVRSKESRIV